MLTQDQKAGKTMNALRQLRKELADASQYNQVDAINDYLLSASNESFARLHDILNPQPRPLSEILEPGEMYHSLSNNESD